MIRLRHTGFRGASSSDLTLNIEYAAELGQLIARARADRQLSVDDVAAALLLSNRQVRALENPEPSAFYGEAYFIKALQKYLEFIGVPGMPADLFERLLAVVPKEDEPGQMPLTAPRVPRRMSSRQVFLVAAALVGIALLGASYLGERLLAPAPQEPPAVASTAPVPPVPLAATAIGGAPFALATPIASQKPVVVERVAADAIGPPAASPAADRMPPRPARDPVGQVAVGRHTWVFVRYGNNEVIERSIGPGVPLLLTSVPIYLAVGVPEVELTLGGESVDVGPYIANGQVRISRAALAALARTPEP